ncbi:MAG: adenosylcobinamide-phosphate synthase CbiB [Desulfovibrionaceae bacterium]
MEWTSFLPLLAFGLDLALGDPHGWPHPVRWIGWGARRLEGTARLLTMNSPSRTAGILASLLLLFLTAIAYGMATALPLLGWLAALYLAYAGLALGCLLREGRNVARLLDQGQLEQARTALSHLVSRDTTELDENACRRTLAETLSENLNDGFTAPFFWLCLLGPLGLWLYKAVSTLDSMWGYRTEEYEHLGWFAARTDDILAWVPARITFGAMLLCGMLQGLDWRAALRHAPLDARKMESPNAGWPMACAAWLLAGSMGGATVYFGALKLKPVLGPEGRVWSSAMLSVLMRLMFWTAVLVALVGQGLALALY